MKFKGIDVSKHQGKICWDKVKASGVEVAIVRCGYGSNMVSQDDAFFEDNFNEAKRVGIKVGVYLYSYAMDVTQAKSEAEHVIRLLKGKTLDYPVYYDLEDVETTEKCSSVVIGDMAETFCTVIETAGYNVGIYASKHWFTSILTDSRFNRWDKWVAQYHSKCTYQGRYTAWQYTSTGKVDGISESVDMSEFYVEYSQATAGVDASSNKISGVSSGKSETLPDLSGYTGTSIADALKGVDYDSSFGAREILAKKLGIVDYAGTAAQNLALIKKLGGTVTQA
jgi:GH25 family lysozyme M1 (1,4-beta-N-acetylmuramidase)